MKKNTWQSWCAVTFAGIFGWLAIATANAVTIQFEYSGSGSGLLGGVVFPSKAFTITAIGDTLNVTNPVPGRPNLYAVVHTSASIAIDGLGSFRFTGATQTIFDDDLDAIGFQTLGGGVLDLFDIVSASLNGLFSKGAGGEVLVSTLSGVSGASELLQWSNSEILVEDAGYAQKRLIFNYGTPAATFSGGATAIPLPGAFALLGSALAACGFFGWRRRRVSEEPGV